MAFYRSLRKLAETNPLKKARLFFQLPAVEPFLRSHRRFRRAAPTLHAQIASPFLMVRPSPRTSIPLFSTLETAPVRDASSLARKQRVLRKVKALSVRLMWVIVVMMVEFEDGNRETLPILKRTMSSHC
ncbi:hypothetical protein YC2023_007280 [Brassica napus]